MIIVLMGPAGVGKSTIGRALASATSWAFLDADDLHPASNVEKMGRGIPLNDDDRRPWLARIREALLEASRSGRGTILACSALRERYRAQMAAGVPDVRWILLRADDAILRDRLIRRPNHFAGLALLDSQLAALEPPADALVVSTGRPVHDVVAEICTVLKLGCAR